jgi:hypothetical protein
MRKWLALLVASSFAALGGCSDAGQDVSTEDDDLTSLTARQRRLGFSGVVYVAPEAAERTIMSAVQAQTKSAFGALLNVKIAVKSREIADVDPVTFKKRLVTVRNPDDPADRGEKKLEVRYRYKDDAVIPVELARRSGLSLALLGQGADDNLPAITAACTKNDKEARDDVAAGFLWYNFDPSRETCRRAMHDEQRAIDAQQARLAGADEVPRLVLSRSFVPATMALEAVPTQRGATYPEYARLFSGGVKPDRLVVSLVVGRMEHHRVEAAKDGGYYEWMDALGVLFEGLPGFTLTKIAGDESVASVEAGGRRIDGLSFKDFVQWTVYDTGYPEGLSAADRTELKKKIGDKLDTRWVTFERKVKVAIGDAPPKDFTIQLDTIFGVDEEPTEHRRALRSSDVVLYNGHSYIGSGPLDPRNYRQESFPESYQLFFFDSCVSYNYYNEDFFTLKAGGTKNLDLISNGLEAPEYRSGEAEGQFLVRLLDGSMPSYQTLLAQAEATDSLRVVDGEVGNAYSPSGTKVRVTAP